MHDGNVLDAEDFGFGMAAGDIGDAGAVSVAARWRPSDVVEGVGPGDHGGGDPFAAGEQFDAADDGVDADDHDGDQREFHGECERGERDG